MIKNIIKRITDILSLWSHSVGSLRLRNSVRSALSPDGDIRDTTLDIAQIMGTSCLLADCMRWEAGRISSDAQPSNDEPLLLTLSSKKSPNHLLNAV